MLPPATASDLNALGHDAVNVRDVGLVETDDEVIYGMAVDARRVIVTENFADFARLVETRAANEEPCVRVVFVRKRSFPRERGLARHLASHLHKWALDNPDPYRGLHWP